MKISLSIMLLALLSTPAFAGLENNQFTDAVIAPDMTVDFLGGMPMHCLNVGIKDEKSVSNNQIAFVMAGAEAGGKSGPGTLTINGKALSPFFVPKVEASTDQMSEFGFPAGTQAKAAATFCWATSTGFTVNAGDSLSIAFLYDGKNGYAGKLTATAQ